MLAHAMLVAVVERGQHAKCAVQARQAIGQPEGRQRRRPVFLAGDVGVTAHGLGHSAEARAQGVGAGLPVGRDRQHDQAGVDAAQVLVAQAPAAHDAGGEVLHHHVADGHQLANERGAVGLAHVQRDAALVARQHFPEQGVPVAGAAPVAKAVTARVLDLYDFSAKVAQVHRSRGAGHEIADVQHA